MRGLLSGSMTRPLPLPSHSNQELDLDRLVLEGNSLTLVQRFHNALFSVQFSKQVLDRVVTSG
jgi:hypothetical protein